MNVQKTLDYPMKTVGLMHTGIIEVFIAQKYNLQKLKNLKRLLR